jgi:hypothetical protein
MSDKNLGVGVMLGMLGGNDETVEAYHAAIGKVIADMNLDADTNHLNIKFADDSGIEIYDDGQSCCESRYMRTDDDLKYHVGATLEKMELREGADREEEYGTHESEFFLITTSRGVITLANHNEHNGYYGGFNVVIRKTE